MTFVTSNSLLKTALRSHKQWNRVRLASYQAAVLKNKDSKELVIEERKRAKLKPNEVRVQVAYCSVNIFDVLHFYDTSSHKFPFVPGFELSGEVLEVGEEAAKSFQKDDRIVALNFSKFGGLATECIVDFKDLWTTPSCIKLRDAAVVPYGHSLALYTFGILSTLTGKESVLVTVGPAGLGLAAVDVAANVYKSKVIAVTDSHKNSDLTRERGAFATMLYSDKIEKEVLKDLEGKCVDVVYDAVGGDLFDGVSSCIAFGGKIFTPIMGKVNVPPMQSSLVGVNFENVRAHSFAMYKQLVNDTLEMVEQGLITAHVSDCFDFKDVNNAIEHIRAKKCTGKIVVKICD